MQLSVQYCKFIQFYVEISTDNFILGWILLIIVNKKFGCWSVLLKQTILPSMFTLKSKTNVIKNIVKD